MQRGLSVSGILIVLTIKFLLLIIPHSFYACTVFCIENGGSPVVGKNDDWHYTEGMIVVNKRNQTKTALTDWGESTNNLARWTSKYGSVTFVNSCREVAFSGMNEAGLTISKLALDQTKYPEPDSRPGISPGQYLQYILDNYKAIDEIIKSDKLIRLRPSQRGSHFFVVDNSGESLSIEFLNGKTVFHYRETMPVKVMANDPYEQYINFYKGWIKHDHKHEHNYESSMNRFIRAAAMVTKMTNYQFTNTADAIKYAFNVLDSARQDQSNNPTRFEIVYDIKNRMIYFKSYRNMKLRYFSFDGFNYSSKSASKVLDLNADLEGDVTSKFINYTTQINEDLLKKSWEDEGRNNINLLALNQISHYPETFTEGAQEKP
jgi:penicillin V acylase-like amidase (Ntn superfamily)